MSCAGCGNTHQAGKLGRCAFCINSNILGAIGGWLVFVVVKFVSPDGNGAWASLAIASFFTLFSIAHLVAYARRQRPSREAEP
jgi:hypothetical protein